MMDLWGRDHWSTLAYIETVMVDCKGFQIGQDGHDDWMCLQDMAEAGLFTCDVFGVQPGTVLKLSPKGQRIVAELRAHKAEGGSLDQFKLKLDQEY